MIRPAESSSTIFDLGYASYEGQRGGRLAVGFALYVFSLRSVFGLGRRHAAKIVPVALTAITLVPAAIQLGIAALADNVVDLFPAEDYYGFIHWILALFVAATATDLVGRDRRSQVLVLYFARGLRREDYVLAKYLASVSALLMLTLVPQTLLFVGNGAAVEDVVGYLEDNWRDLPPIFASAVALSFYLSALSLVVAAATTRRSFAAGTIVGYFAISHAVAAAAVGMGSASVREWAPLLSGFEVLSGTTLWLFDAQADSSSMIGRAGQDLYWYAIALALVSLGSVSQLLRAYRGMKV